MSSVDLFRELFKYYKCKSKPPDLNTVRNLSDGYVFNSFEGNEIFAYEDLAGVYGIENLFTEKEQAEWIHKCLSVYPSYDDCVSNLDAFSITKLRDPVELFKRNIRWITLGFHHDWNTKVYDLSKKSKFPTDDLSPICAKIANHLGFIDYCAEASIVNYYPLGSTLSGHTDHSEIDKEAPLISLSFGQSAVFLVGGPTKATRPVPFFIRSGDIIVMTREARLNYHGVPLVFSENSESRWGDTKYLKEWEASYIRNHRINVNVRQVFPSAQNILSR